MTTRPVCAVIVTYHPTAGMLENLPATFAQVQGMVVVDNGSTACESDLLRAASQSLGFHLVENGENLGIAEALNRGTQWAKANGFIWVILFDQDSKITEYFVDRMLSGWEFHPQRDRIGSIHPRYVEPGTGYEAPVPRASDGGPKKSFTSGSLIPVWIFDEIGWFASEYFIDEVDTEYSFRIRAAGYLIADVRSAVLLHSVANPKEVCLLGFRFRPSYHNATRRYYMSRNRVALLRTYLGPLPCYVLPAIGEWIGETIKCFLAENDRAHKFRSLLLGICDGLTGRMGRREGL